MYTAAVPSRTWRASAALCIFGMFAAMFIGQAGGIMSLPEFFPQIQGDLTKVTWAHAVNDMSLLVEAMEGDVMMLEADVVLGSLSSSPGEILPVMAHPPANTSDLSLDSFLEYAARKSSKGVKLDFKTTEAFKASLPVLAKFKDKMAFPVMLNADILQGPIQSKRPPVDSDAFLYACKTIFPFATLSVGWTTLYGSDEGYSPPSTGAIPSYSRRNVLDMLDALRANSVTQAVTFPVRAGLAAGSIESMVDLLSGGGNTTLTIWSAKDDPVDVLRLKSLIARVGRRRVYVDIPETLERELSSGGAAIRPATLVLSLLVCGSLTLLSHLLLDSV